MSLSQNPRDIYLFRVEDYKVVRSINRGGFGEINLVRNNENGEEYAAKTNYIDTESSNKIFILREVRILIQIQHPTIVRFRGFSYRDFDNKKNITILMDYMKDGSLADLIEKEMRSLCPSDYNNTKRQIILIGIARGMMILHSRHVIHRDLKPENILLDENFYPHITDFGLSKFFDPQHSMNQTISNSGTAPYMAPEVINSDHFNTKADVFAFGILMYEVVTGKRAYSDLINSKKIINDFQLKMKVTSGLRPEFEDDDSINQNLRILIQKCWSENPKDRPTFSEIYRKLSLSQDDDYFFAFEENYTDPILIDENDDEKYCLNDVDYEEILYYIDEINEEPKSLILHNDKTSNNEDIQKLKEKVSFLESELKAAKNDNSIIESQMKIMSQTIKDQSDLILKLERKIQNQGLSHFFNVDLSYEEPGILYRLKNQEASPFDPLFIASQSSNDPYNVLDPSTKDMFGVAFNSKFYIEFVLEEEVSITGFKVFSSYVGFPKSFDIEVEGKLVHQISLAKELNGKDKEMKLSNDPICGKKIKFIRTGPSWDQGDGFYTIKRFEILSNDDKYSKGVFYTLVKNCMNDPHKCPVLINATYFDFNKFYMINKDSHISTLNAKDSWFQIELSKGFAIITGFRLQRCNSERLKSFMIQCKIDDKWITLFDYKDKNIKDDNLLAIYKLPQ